MSFSSWLRNGKRSAPAAHGARKRSLANGPASGRGWKRSKIAWCHPRPSCKPTWCPTCRVWPRSRRELGQSLGAGRQSHRHVVGGQRGHRHQYPVQHLHFATYGRVVGRQHSAQYQQSPFPIPNSPTGIVYNTGGPNTFDLTPNDPSTSSHFLFDTLDGTISGWSSGSNATVMVQNDNAVYTGLALATDSHGDPLLYAANFAQGTIEVYDQNFQSVTTLPSNAFTDSQLPAGYSPFNIQAINNKLYVEYAPVTPVLDGLTSPATGAVDVYNANGKLLQRLIPQGQQQLDEPWAVAMAPANFGSFSNDLLVGNFGNGQINAFNPKNGQFVGVLQDASGQPIAIPHLWGLEFGNGGAAGPTNTLYFTAGLTSHLAPSDAPFHGQFGSLTAARGHEGHNDDGGQHGPLDQTSITSTSSPNGMLEQQIDAIFQEFDAVLSSLESNLTAMHYPQLSGFFAMLHSNLDALETTVLDRLDALETA